jgi:hypothetical protein
MPILQKISRLSQGGQAGREAPSTELGTIADESAQLVTVAKELLEIANRENNPELAEALSGPISQILNSATAVSSSVIRLARTGN